MGLFSFFKNKKKKEEALKYKIGMEKTRKSTAFSRLANLFKGHNQIDEDLFDELEEIFVMADIGIDTVVKFVEELKSDEKVKGLTSAKELQPIIIDKMFDIYLKGEIIKTNLNFNKDGLSVFLFVGVNGVGKTTTIAKIAHKLINEGKKVLVAAGDTFRAGASEQLQVWGKRVGFEVVTKEYGSDPSSVIYEGIAKAKKEGYQTKVNLMKELEKMKKVISREVEGAPQDTLLIIDATTGQNGLSQAKAFLEATDVSGIVLTKLDGTAKGGIVLAIRDTYNVPIKFIGLGEGMDDLEYFDIEKYVYGLFAEMIDEEESE